MFANFASVETEVICIVPGIAHPVVALGAVTAGQAGNCRIPTILTSSDDHAWTDLRE